MSYAVVCCFLNAARVHLSVLTPLLYISDWSGVTFAVLQSRGMQPVSSDLRKIVAIGLAISLLIFLSRRG